MPIVRAGTAGLHVLDRGQGPVVLLVHGFPLDHAMWERQLEPLAEHYRVIAPDLRGFGRSEATAGDDTLKAVTMEQFADDLVALLDALHITEPIVLCGLSMGGYIGWQFCRKHAARLRGLVACDTRAVADTPEAAAGRLQMAEKVLRDGAVVAADAMLPKLFAPQTLANEPRLVERVRAQILATHPESIAAAQRGMAQRGDASDLLPTIRVPTLLIVGEQDAISTPAEMQSIAAAIPAAELVVIPRAGHLSPLENPAAFNQALMRFLARLP